MTEQGQPDARAAGQGTADGWDAPPALVAHARRFYAEGATPVPARVAATVVLLRAAAGGIEAYAIRRAATMAFASGMYAFPGGSVDPADSDASIEWAGPDRAAWAERLSLPVGAAQAVVCAAVREVFEEAGVLLAGPAERPGAESAARRPGAESTGADTVIGDVSGPDWEGVRRALVARETSLTACLAARHLAVRSDLLVPWARWITPEFEPRRFDTYFFVARLPEGQRTRDVSGEADRTEWVRPADALARYAAGEMAMLPPTAVMLRDLAAFDDVGAVLAAAAGRDAATPVTPRLTLTPDGGRFTLE